jgi:hypothetical protein
MKVVIKTAATTGGFTSGRVASTKDKAARLPSAAPLVKNANTPGKYQSKSNFKFIGPGAYKPASGFENIKNTMNSAKTLM